MAHITTWIHDKRIIYVQLMGEFAMGDVDTFGQELITQYLDVGQKPVHLVVDIREMSGFPTHLARLAQAAAPMDKHPNMGWQIVIGKPNALFGFLANVLTKISNVNYRNVDTLEEAVAMLQKVDLSLDGIELKRA
jgi:hypothetical protein